MGHDAVIQVGHFFKGENYLLEKCLLFESFLLYKFITRYHEIANGNNYWQLYRIR